MLEPHRYQRRSPIPSAARSRTIQLVGRWASPGRAAISSYHLAEAAPEGIDRRSIERAADQVITDPRVLVITDPSAVKAEPMQDDRTPQRAGRAGDVRYTTVEMVGTESRLLAAAIASTTLARLLLDAERPLPEGGGLPAGGWSWSTRRGWPAPGTSTGS